MRTNERASHWAWGRLQSRWNINQRVSAHRSRVSFYSRTHSTRNLLSLTVNGLCKDLCTTWITALLGRYIRNLIVQPPSALWIFLLILDLVDYFTDFNMTLEEVVGSNSTVKKMETVSQALEELLVAAQQQDCVTVGVYESAKLMNVDPDSVVLCILATDEEDEDDIALQIHFTLLQAFCCDNDINIVRVSGMRRLAQLLKEDTEDSNSNEPRDLHCILVTNPPVQPLQCQALQEVGSFCEESRCSNQWVPCLELQDR